MSPCRRLIEALEARGGRVHKAGRGWTAQCPAHEDGRESLSVGEGHDGRALVKCFAGCETAAVVAALGLDLRDLFPRDGRRGSGGRTMKVTSHGVTIEHRPVRRYDYLDEAGAKRAFVQRWEPKRFTQGRYLANGDTVHGLAAGWYAPGRGSKEWWPVKGPDGSALRSRREPPPPETGAVWMDKCGPMLYRLPDVLWAAANGAQVWVVEGEKDADTLAAAGVVATTWLKAGTGGKAHHWPDKFSEQLRGAAEVVIVADKDEAGRAFAARTEAALAQAGVPCRVVEARAGKDATDHVEAGYSLNEFVLLGGPVEPGGPVATTCEEHGKHAYTDLGNAERLVARFGADLRWCEGFREWLHWDGTAWRADSTGGLILGKAIEVARGIALESPPPGEKADALLGWAVRSQMRPRLEAMIEVAKGLAGVQVGYWELDARPDLLATPSGTVELRTGRLREASREDLLTRRTAVRYDPEARPQAWLEFLRDVCQGQEWMASYLWRALGYGLTGEVGEHCLFFLHGRGRNGKSTLIETVRKVLGEVALVSETDTLMSQDRGGSAIRTDIARLKEARFVAMEETAKAGRFDAGTMKRLTGGTRIVARTVYKPEIEFDPQCKFYVCGNHKPHVTETDDGTWRRIRLIPFEHQIPEGRVDKRMGERLMAEAEGVLAWLIEGARRWYESGLAEPDEVTAAVAEYRDDMDTIGHFLREETRVAPGAATQKKPFYERYKTWAKARNHYVLNIKQLAMDMKDRGFRDKKLESGLHWLDVELVEAGLLEDA